MTRAKPHAELRFREIKGEQMAFFDEDQGDAMVFAQRPKRTV
jgi:hypothetical protein